MSLCPPTKSNKSTVVKGASEPESFSISAEDCQSTIVGSAAGPRLARLRRKSAPKGGGVTRRRNRDAGQEAQARIYISIAPCAEKFLPNCVENDVAFLRTLRMASSALLPRPCATAHKSLVDLPEHNPNIYVLFFHPPTFTSLAAAIADYSTQTPRLISAPTATHHQEVASNPGRYVAWAGSSRQLRSPSLDGRN